MSVDSDDDGGEWSDSASASTGSLASFTSAVYRRIQEARTSTARVAYVDLFVGPLTGRVASMKKICTLAQEIGSSLEFHFSEPLLVIRCPEPLLSGKLLIIGGGHRFLAGARQKHMLLFPYQLVDISNLYDEDIPLHFKRHEFLLVHHVKASEPRPDKYGIMSQVSEYEKLRNYWMFREKRRIEKIRATRPSARPLALTHRKIYELYKVLFKPVKRRKQHAISFLSSEVEKTRTGYMSGADRLIKADGVNDLCFLEGSANTCFSLSSLNTVRNWSTAKIIKTVKSMMATAEENPSVVLKFVNDRKKRSKRPNTVSNRSTTQLPTATVSDAVTSKPPVGWEHYMDWTAEGDMEFVENLKQRLEQEDDSFQQKAGSTVTVIEDNKNKLKILDNVRERMTSMLADGTNTFDIASLITEETSKLPTDTESSGALAVMGGVLQDELKLNRRDAKSIIHLKDATDQAVLYTILFLSNWTVPALKEVYLLDPLFTQGWWDVDLPCGSDALRAREKRVREHPESKIDKHELVRTSNTTFIYMCGKDHWTLAVLFGLPHLLNWMENHSDFQDSSAITRPKLARCLILDSMDKNSSPHSRMTRNLFRYICCANPGQHLDPDQLLSFTTVHEHRRSLQKGRECGFFATYHASIVLRNIDVFRTGGAKERRIYLNEAYRTFSFSRYAHLIQTRMRVMSFKFEKNGRRTVHSNVFLWDEDVTSKGVEVVVGNEADPPSCRTRSKTKSVFLLEANTDTNGVSGKKNVLAQTESSERTLNACLSNGDHSAEDGVSITPHDDVNAAAEVSAQVRKAGNSRSGTEHEQFLEALVDFCIRTSVESELHDETKNRVLNDPKVKNALRVHDGSTTLIQSITDLTPIVAPHIQKALKGIAEDRTRLPPSSAVLDVQKKTKDSTNAIKEATTENGANEDELDVASMVVENVEVIKEAKDAVLQNEWIECMKRAKTLIEEARKKRRLY